MEIFVSSKNSAKYGFRKGDEFPILRTIMGECVLIVEDVRKPNIIVNESVLRRYGKLTGVPTLGG